MNDRINKIKEQAKVILEWCRQQQLAVEERDILEFRPHGLPDWEEVFEPAWNFALGDYRLRKRPKTHTATVYWYQHQNGTISHRVTPTTEGAIKLLGTSAVEFTEPQE